MNIHRICVPLAMLVLGLAAPAQELRQELDREIVRDKPFLTVYARYLDAVNTRGADGLKPLLASDFKFHSVRGTLTGEKALAELRKYVYGPQTDITHLAAVKLRRLTFQGDQVDIQTEETATFASKDTSVQHVSMSWFWKQTWRKTPAGWRLIGWQKGLDTLPSAAVTLSYTVTWTPKEPSTSSAPPSEPR